MLMNILDTFEVCRTGTMLCGKIFHYDNGAFHIELLYRDMQGTHIKCIQGSEQCPYGSIPFSEQVSEQEAADWLARYC